MKHEVKIREFLIGQGEMSKLHDLDPYWVEDLLQDCMDEIDRLRRGQVPYSAQWQECE